MQKGLKHITDFSMSVTFMLSTHILLFTKSIRIIVYIDIKTGEGNSTPLQYSCLENPMDRGA